MSSPFPADQVVQCYLDTSSFTATEVQALTTPYWTRLKVPEDLPVFKDDRPWAAAILAHYNPTSERCFAVALATEEMIEPFLARYPDGIGTGTPNDEKWAAEIKASRQLTATRVEAKGIVVLNVLPLTEEERADLGEYAGPDELAATSVESPDSTFTTEERA